MQFGRKYATRKTREDQKETLMRPVLKALSIGLAIVLMSTPAAARIPRSAAAVSEFKRHNPCPANGHARGSCPGWQVDHIDPLCNGGPDISQNMQWLTVQDHKLKTRQDIIHCRLRSSNTH